MTFTRHTFLRLSGFTFLAAAARKLVAGVPTRWGMAIDTAKMRRAAELLEVH